MKLFGTYVGYSWLVALLCCYLSVGQLVAWGQSLPPANSTPVAFDEVERQRIITAKIEVIRKAFVEGNYGLVLKECAEAERVDPSNKSIQLYKDWANSKIQSKTVIEQADVDRAEVPTAAMPQTSSHSPVSKPTRQEATPFPTSTPAVPQRAAPEASSPAPSAQPWGKLLVGVVGILIIAAGGSGVAVMLRRRKEKVLPTESTAPAEKKVPEETSSLSAEMDSLSKQISTSPGGGTPALGMGIHTSGLGTPSVGGLQTPVSSVSLKKGVEDVVAEQRTDDVETVKNDVAVSSENVSPPPLLGSEEQWTPPSLEPPSPSTVSSDKSDEPLSFASFDEIGINIPLPEEETISKEVTETPPRAYTASLEDSRIVITPAPGKSDSEKLVREDREAPSKEGASLSGAGAERDTDLPFIKLEDILSAGVSPAQPHEVVVEKAQELSAALEGVPHVSSLPDEPSSKVAPEGMESLSLELADGELDGLTVSDIVSASDEKRQPQVDKEEKTPHDTTIVLSGEERESNPTREDENLGETKTLVVGGRPDGVADAFAETKVMEIPPRRGAPTSEQPSPSSPSGGSDSEERKEVAPSDTQEKLDPQAERMFREQYERGLRALEEQNFKQAVHFLSIAAAIRPSHAEVREKLRLARERKRQQETGKSS